jgi:hypothetical protein
MFFEPMKQKRVKSSMVFLGMHEVEHYRLLPAFSICYKFFRAISKIFHWQTL